MAVLERIRNFFISAEPFEPEIIVPAPPTTYVIHPLTDNQLQEVLLLNLRCFKKGENYTKHTFNYLLSDPTTLSYRIVTATEQMAGFIFVMISKDGSGHITTIGVAPEHRRRGLAERLLKHAEQSLKNRRINTIMLEVRVSNIAAQSLYRGLGYTAVQRLNNYYNNGEDGFLMVKSLF